MDAEKTAHDLAQEVSFGGPFIIEPILLAALREAHRLGEGQYMQLIMAVERKYPGETRHQTALRYIRQTEQRYNSDASAIRALPLDLKEEE